MTLSRTLNTLTVVCLLGILEVVLVIFFNVFEAMLMFANIIGHFS